MKLDRLHLTLGVLLALGVAFRAIRERAPQHSVARTTESAALNRQISEVSNRRRAGKQKGPASAANPPREAALPPSLSGGSAPRSESTPIGALSPDRASTAGTGRPALLVDLDAASAASIESLPRIGPALARRIVEDRAARGPFGSLEGLDRVRGIGPALRREIGSYVTFSTSGRPSTVAAVPPPAENAGRGKGRRRPPASAVR
jgi:DNA uptake protein ComE-like DNA-binding protein